MGVPRLDLEIAAQEMYPQQTASSWVGYHMETVSRELVKPDRLHFPFFLFFMNLI
jgi:hypothetical protein